jgi:polysaccharide biosynthesis protein PslF
MYAAEKASLGFVGTFPPTQCGIATFTAALLNAMAPAAGTPKVGARRVGVIEVVGRDDEALPMRAPVVGQWHHGDELSLRRAVNILDTFDAVVVQHEYGIFGGIDGAEIIPLLERVAAPTIVIAHTVREDPTEGQKRVLEDVVAACSQVVVMTETARRRLVTRHDVDASKVLVIPHGAHPAALPPPEVPNRRPIILTWGLIGPGKGIEWAIDAMAEVRELLPTPRYIIAGQTHPKVLARNGEAYRHELMERAKARGVDHIVEFDSKYRSLGELADLVATADVVLLPYESKEQVTSGVLIEAVTAGKPVVATAFPHAMELLSSGAGSVVRHGDTMGMGAALRSILIHPNVSAAMRTEARRIAPNLLWSNVGARYDQVVSSVLRPAAGVRA